MANTKTVENRKLISSYKKYIKKYIKFNWKLFLVFLSDIIIFGTVVISFFVLTFNHQNNSKETQDVLKYMILGLSFYILVKFTATNFYYGSMYYKQIILYDKKLTINEVEINTRKTVEYVSIKYNIGLILMNIITAIILNYESDTLFDNQKIVKALVTTLSSLLLIPSFVTSLNNLFTTKSSFNHNYKFLVRDQFIANNDLLKNYSPVGKFECIQLNKIDLTSKRGIFLINNYDDEKTNKLVMKHNHEIIDVYKEIWEKYCEYLYEINNVKISKINKYATYYIQRIFDIIFIDFFDI